MPKLPPRKKPGNRLSDSIPATAKGGTASRELFKESTAGRLSSQELVGMLAKARSSLIGTMTLLNEVNRRLTYHGIDAAEPLFQESDDIPF